MSVNTKNYPKKVKVFLDDVYDNALKNNIEIRLGSGKSIQLGAGQYGGGYFCSAERTLAVATNMSLAKWLGIFVHESCHLDQWAENSRYWNLDLEKSYKIFDKYIAGSEQKNIESAIDNIVMMEADCERRAYRKIEEYGLPLCLDRYARQANSYLYGHKAMLHYKSWYKRNMPKMNYVHRFMPTEIYAPHKYRMKNAAIDPTLFEKCFV